MIRTATHKAGCRIAHRAMGLVVCVVLVIAGILDASNHLAHAHCNGHAHHGAPSSYALSHHGLSNIAETGHVEPEHGTSGRHDGNGDHQHLTLDETEKPSGGNTPGDTACQGECHTHHCLTAVVGTKSTPLHWLAGSACIVSSDSLKPQTHGAGLYRPPITTL